MKGGNPATIKDPIEVCPQVDKDQKKGQDVLSETIKPGMTSGNEQDLNVSCTSYLSINDAVIKDSTREILGKNETKTYRGSKLKAEPK